MSSDPSAADSNGHSGGELGVGRFPHQNEPQLFDFEECHLCEKPAKESDQWNALKSYLQPWRPAIQAELSSAGLLDHSLVIYPSQAISQGHRPQSLV